MKSAQATWLLLVAGCPWLAWFVQPDVVWRDTLTPITAFVFVGFLLICWMIGRTDAWMGALGGWGVLSAGALAWQADGLASVFTAVNAFWTVLYLLLGLVALTLLRTMDSTMQCRAVWSLTVAGTGYAFLAIWQAVDVQPGWDGTDVGSVGLALNPGLVGVLLGLLLPVVWFWAVPVLLVGLVVTHSMTGLVAGGMGLVVKGWQVPSLIPYRWGMIGVLAVAIMAVWMGRDTLGQTFSARWAMWEFVVPKMLHDPRALWGFGIGRWLIMMPPLQLKAHIATEFPMRHAHNEYLQAWFELGAVGVSLIGGWLWMHRRIFLNGGIVALAVTCLVWFPLHVPTLALSIVLILALALSQEDVCLSKS